MNGEDGDRIVLRQLTPMDRRTREKEKKSNFTELIEMNQYEREDMTAEVLIDRFPGASQVEVAQKKNKILRSSLHSNRDERTESASK